jgi:uncharacterized membrane protein
VEVLVSSFCKGWKTLVNNVLLSIKIILTSALELIHEFIWNSGQPSLILVPVLSVSVTIMHDVVVNCRFYIRNSKISVSSFYTVFVMILVTIQNQYEDINKLTKKSLPLYLLPNSFWFST